MKLPDTLLDIFLREKQAEINKNFLQDWTPFDVQFQKVKTAILNNFMRKGYTWQPSNNKIGAMPFTPITFSQIDARLGLAYTSSSSYAGLWVCNSGYLFADNTHYFIGFAINELGEVIGIAHDENEHEYFVKM